MELHAWASFFSFVRPRMERETMRSITDWSLLASVHQKPVPSQVTAAGSCAQVTRPGTTPRGTPNGEGGSNKRGRRQLAAAIDRANCRRVISILTCSSMHKILRFRGSFCLKAQKLLQPLHTQHGLGLETDSCSAGTLNCPVNCT